jgi:hypothetical protein
MYDPCRKPSGIDYTKTVALLVVALVFSPAALAISHPFGYLALTGALACSALCLSLAWVAWRRSSQLYIPSIETPVEKGT